MPKKNLAAFKAAFAPIRKPKLPVKTTPDRIITKDQKAEAEKGIGDRERFEKATAEIFKRNPEYFKDLAAYKIGKHIGDKKKLPKWMFYIPEDARAEVIAKVVPEDMSDRRTQAAFDKALETNDEDRISILKTRDPEGAKARMLDRLDTETNPAVVGTIIKAIAPGPDTWGPIALAAARTGDPAFAKDVANSLCQLAGRTGSTADAADVARENPAFFIKHVFPQMKADQAAPEVFADRDLQEVLKKADPKGWAELVEATPQLKVIDTVDKRLPKNPSAGQVASEVFSALMNNEGIALAYYTGTNDDNRVILGGGTPEDAKAREEKGKTYEDLTGKQFPETPATQCAMLVKVLRTLLASFPNVGLNIKEVSVDHMLLTEPLNAIPGKSLLDKKFEGNVFADGGGKTKRIFFTGEGGIKAHTWLEINGVAYDPVLGTTGGEVAASNGGEYEFVIRDFLAKGKGGKSSGYWLVSTAKLEALKDLVADPNPMGFGPGYVLTTSPEKYLTDEQCATAGLEPVERREKLDV